jgi:hypothetical protein
MAFTVLGSVRRKRPLELQNVYSCELYIFGGASIRLCLFIRATANGGRVAVSHSNRVE